MKKITLLTMGLMTASSSLFAYTGSNLEKSAKISMDKAQVLAVKAFHGKIVDRELEKEKGSLRYSFDIKRGQVTQEVGIDAMSGKVIENKIADKD